MLTWSSWLAEVGVLSVTQGFARCLFSLISAAVVTSAIIRPEFSPGSGVRKGGRSKLNVGSTISATRRCAMAPTSLTASAIMSAAKPTGSAWKFPPETISPAWVRTSGLSVAAFASISSVRAAWRSTSIAAPVTCGWQRMQYGSCTRLSPSRWLSRMTEPSRSARIAAAASICPAWPRKLWISGCKGAVEPMIASVDKAEITSADRAAFQAPNRPASA